MRHWVSCTFLSPPHLRKKAGVGSVSKVSVLMSSSLLILLDRFHDVQAGTGGFLTWVRTLRSVSNSGTLMFTDKILGLVVISDME